MEKVFEELWYGNICPSENYRKNTKENKALMSDFLKHYEQLVSCLSEEQQKSFEKYEECGLELEEVEKREVFEYGFSLGVRLAIEILH